MEGNFVNGSLRSYLRLLALRPRSVDESQRAKIGKKTKEDYNSHQTHKYHSFTQKTQRCLTHFLGFAKIKETWT